MNYEWLIYRFNCPNYPMRYALILLLYDSAPSAVSRKMSTMKT